MRSQIEHGTQPDSRIHNRDRDRAFIALRIPDAAQDVGRTAARAIHNNRFEPVPGQPAQRAFGVATQLHRDLQVAQHAAQHPNNFFIRAQHQGLKDHGLSIDYRLQESKRLLFALYVPLALGATASGRAGITPVTAVCRWGCKSGMAHFT